VVNKVLELVNLVASGLSGFAMVYQGLRLDNHCYTIATPMPHPCLQFQTTWNRTVYVHWFDQRTLLRYIDYGVCNGKPCAALVQMGGPGLKMAQHCIVNIVNFVPA